MDMLLLCEGLLIKANIIKMNAKLIKIDIGYAIFNSNIHGEGEYN